MTIDEIIAPFDKDKITFIRMVAADTALVEDAVNHYAVNTQKIDYSGAIYYEYVIIVGNIRITLESAIFVDSSLIKTAAYQGMTVEQYRHYQRTISQGE